MRNFINVCEGKIPKELSKKYPDTAEGAKAALADMSIYKLEDMVGAKADPQVEGVWQIRIKNNDATAAIVYLAGYREPFGDLRDANDFEDNA